MCDLGGSINNDCNIETGKCTCKHKYVIGDKCEKCMEGYYKHPECKGTVLSDLPIHYYQSPF